MDATARSAILFACILALSGCGGSKPAAPPAPVAAQRNLLLITLDTTRADHLGCYGDRAAGTPVLDALAARGVRFDQAICNVPLTRPSHTTILTGLLPQRHGVWSNGPYRLDPKFPTLAQRFRESGYHTAAVVASFVLSRSFGLDHGFDLYDDRLRETTGADPEKPANEVAAAAAAWLDHPLQPPFFLWLHFYDPHYPYTPPAGYSGDPYDGEIAFMDREIGVVLQALEAKGWLANTLVVAAGDHGEGLGEHGETTHGYYLYDSTMRVPLIVAGPGVAAGQTISATVSLADLMPTFLEAFQMRKDQDRFDGRSFWQGIQSGKLEPRDVVMENRSIHYQFGWAALTGLRTGDSKWIGAPQEELYDLKNDPRETKNVAAEDASRTAALRNLSVKLRPKSDASGAASASGLSPEEEAKLASLGYISGGASGDTDVFAGPDPKRFAGALDAIDRLIHARQERDFASVEDLVTRVLKLDPGNLFALRCKGEVLIEQRQYAEALAVLKRIVAANENHPETFSYLGLAYERTGDPASAVQWYEKASSPPWIYWPSLESLARMSVQHPALLSRDRCLQKLAGLQPASFREQISVARAYAILSDYERGAGWYRKALESKPDAPEAQVGLGQMLQKTGNLSEAEATLLRVEPPTVESRYVLATIQLGQGKKDAACTNFVEASRMQPRNTNLLCGVAAGLQSCGYPEDAARCYERVLTVEPQRPEALFQLAQIENGLGHRERARSLYQRFLQSAPPQMDSEIRIARKQTQ